jgi:hypothetical protein
LRKTTLLALGALACSSGAIAKPVDQTTPAVISSLVACKQIADMQQRLACYDRATEGLNSAIEKGDVAVVSREQASKTRKSLFGFAVPDFPFLRGKGEEGEIKEIASTVVSASPAGNGYYRIVIADANAVWETTEGSLGFRDPKPGQPITIKKGFLGAYWVKVGRGAEVRARRVR